MIKTQHYYHTDLVQLKKLCRIAKISCTPELVKQFTRKELISYLLKNRYKHLQDLPNGTILGQDHESPILIPNEGKDKYEMAICKVIDHLSKTTNLSVLEIILSIQSIKCPTLGK